MRAAIVLALAGVLGGCNALLGVHDLATDALAPDTIPTADADPNANGFAPPTDLVHANDDQGDLGVADLSCLGTASSDEARKVPLQLTTALADFQTNAAVAGATVSAFAGVDPSQSLAAGVSGSDGKVSINVPKSDVPRFGLHVSGGTGQPVDTYLFDLYLTDPSAASLALAPVIVASPSIENLVFSILGVAHVDRTAILDGTIGDCNHHYVSNAIATVSSTPTTATLVDGVATFYYNGMLPVRHATRAVTDPKGLFLVVDVPEATSSAPRYLQVWGFTTADELAAQHLHLLAQLGIPVVADALETIDVEPLRTGN